MLTAASGQPPRTLKPEPETSGTTPVRLHELDGLRGWAALSVVLFHLFWETFAIVAPGFRNPVSSIFLDGQFAVWIFFVLSGEALSTTYFAGKGEASVVKLAVRRYTRLTLPILATCAIVLALMAADLIFNQEAGEIVDRRDWLSMFLTEPPSILAYARYALAGVYVSTPPPGFGVPFLWTMHYEMLGSFIVFGVLLAYRHLRRPAVVVFALASAAWFGQITGPFACFLFGVVFSQLRMRGFFAAVHRNRLYQAASWIGLAGLAVILSHYHLTGGLRDRIVVAAPFVFVVSCNKTLCDFLASGPSRWLGKLSFPLYLMQFPVLMSFTSWAIVFASEHGGLSLPAVWAINLSSLAACFALAWMFMPVEDATRRVGDWVSRRLLAVPTPQDRPA